ncbi:MAG: DUF1295 domain-containing protein [Candidatus Babeliales bacterium]|nr:DUF1295 domain-containing protein [Candidatus Babeliales bacterium]
MYNLYIQTLIKVVPIIICYMTFWFIISIIKKRNDIADVAWGTGFIVACISALFLNNVIYFRSVLATTLVFIWGVRIATHIYLRNKDKKEDYRYLELTAQWGQWFYLRSYLQIFLLQGFILIIIATPVLFINTFYFINYSFYDILGFIIWLIGFIFETVSDWQLGQFLKNPTNKGKILQTGLWQFSRHPNYFGEVTQWWGLYCIALALPYGFATIIGPLTITFLILYVSGIPLLEKSLTLNPYFKEYAKRTSKFFPLPPR